MNKDNHSQLTYVRVIAMFGSFKVGDKGKIIDISKVGRMVQRRLLDLGITEGSEVCVKCVMPFGGPVMIESCGQCVGLRRKEACLIEVERV
jgi:ferrous iron transport protein A